ncbi:MAG: glycosyltransferase family 2 protein [Desulfosarcina sp.]|nr:glycosyltransferase family 2 protein [Desulfosarcina sp.]
MDNDFPLVTIGIPTYNRAHSMLTHAISSACNQDYPNIEIIISDNCSNDNTNDVVNNFNDERIVYIRQKENIGANNNFNECLRSAKGDYFLLLHDDDLIDADFISTCMQTAKYSKDFGFIRTGTRIIGKNDEHIQNEPNLVYSNNPDEMFLAWVSWRTSFYLCGTLFNTQALKEMGGFKSKNNLFEDGFAIIKLSAEYPILNIVDIKSSFRHHDQQRTHYADALNWSEDFRIALDMIYLQDTIRRKEIYHKGMKLFTKVAIEQFARKIKNPIKRMVAVIWVGKYFPYYYWPNSPDISFKSRAARTIAKLIFHDKKCLLK